MDYKELNKIQKGKMEAISDPVYIMKWENPEFMDYLMGELPKVRIYQQDTEVEDEVAELKNVLEKYNPFFTNKNFFLDEVANRISNIHNLKESWCGLSLYEIEVYLKIHKFCLISGEGGIGKSYFIKCFEEQLEQRNINHLCIYGKFEKSTDNIEIEEIKKASQKGFVFIVDAINEMPEEGQKSLLGILTELKEHNGIRIVVSYRTNSMDSVILRKFQEISEYEYKFPGVSFESALSEILKLSIPDVYMYEDILYSNNALLLSMLCDALASQKIVNETENGIASITFILERYIKNAVGKVFKGNLTCEGVDVWKDTKRVAKWMYMNGEKNIDENSLFSVIKTGDNFISSMIQMGFMDCYENNNKKLYYFVIDSLTDFLIARSLFEEIAGKSREEQIRVIKLKVKSLYNIEEALIIAIFDNMSPNYERIKDLLISTRLIENLDINTLVKIHFKREDIVTFLETFHLMDHSRLLQVMGGYTDKPFNCSNYLFDYYCSSRERLCDLSNTLAGFHFQSEIKNRLKNVLYFTTLNNRKDRRDDEAFYFGLLCCAAPNKDVRCLAVKLLYEIISKNERYVEKLIFEYEKVSDFYIKESIIYVLSKKKKSNGIILGFFNKIIEKEEYLTAKSIRRISAYFEDPYSYIKWNRKNLFKYNKDATVSDYLNEILLYVDIMNKDYLPFRYWSKDHVDMHTTFLINDKHDIKKINDYLGEKYYCVCGGDCSGSMVFEDMILSEIESIEEIEEMDQNSFMESFETVLRYIFECFNVQVDRKSMGMREEDFNNSVYMKCVDIATGVYYGSLMCNYYTNEFATYNNVQNSIGYEVYDPLEYGEEINITAPIPTYQDFIERLGDNVLNSLEVQELHDAYWVRNVELTKKNVLHLFDKNNLGHQEWVLLACSVSMFEKNKYGMKWRDTYDLWCCTSEKETINNDGYARYLTIELEEYQGELKSYPDNVIKPWLCKSIKNINSQSSVFDTSSLVLPPSEIIKFFNLKLNISDLSWETQDNEKVVICNNNKHSYYRDHIGRTVFIRRDYLNKFLEGHTIKYFAFTERFIPETGYADETSLHFEIINGQIVKEIRNDDISGREDSVKNSICSECQFFNFEKDKSDRPLIFNMENIKNIINEYGGLK